jgi:fructose-specific phosphotransferase system component IIB
MSINKDNYEEYFLLFADNELSGEEKNMIQAFVNQHPELEEEFVNIVQSVLSTEDDLKLDDKSSLFRQTKKFISHANYTEAFVLYNDNELTYTEKRETEAFLAENPSLKSEFVLLQNAKLQPDNTIVFPGKQLLFKRKGKAKVVSLKWRKAVAAAMILSFGLWMGTNLQKKNADKIPVAVKVDPAKNLNNTNVITTDTINTQPVVVVTKNKPANKSNSFAKQKTFLSNNTSPVIVKAAAKVTAVSKIKNEKTSLPQVNSNINKDEKDELSIIAKELQKSNIESPVAKNKGVQNISEENPGEENNNKEVTHDEIVNADTNEVDGALSASYILSETENKDNYAFYNITEEKFNKSKVGGFFKKVKRVIGRKINPLNNSGNRREMAVN